MHGGRRRLPPDEAFCIFHPHAKSKMPKGAATKGVCMTNRIILSSLFSIFGPAAAFAHGGHIGELAGHSHWAGLAALAGAVVIAGAVAWVSRKAKTASEAETETAESDNEPTEETAR